MHAKIIIWRLGPDHREEQAYHRFVRAFAQTSMAKLRPFGLLDGFLVRLNDNAILTINLYEQRDEAWAAWESVVSQSGYGTEGDLEIIFRIIAPVEDLPLLTQL